MILANIKRHLTSRADSEHEQAILRIVIVALVLAYMAVTYSPSELPSAQVHGELLLLEGLSAALALALAIFVAICIWPANNVPRRVIGMFADAGAATFCMFLAAEAGVSMIGVYLFITFGNGFRYGRAYLFGCQLLCLIGYAAVLTYAPYWQTHAVAGWCLMVALVVLPLYVSSLLKRIQEARAKAEEANLAKSSFLANMSHEMRTPLNGIVGVVDLLQVTTLSSQQVELMRLLRHSVTLLRSLVDDVLDISKIEAGRVTIEISDFDLHATLSGLVALLRPHASSKGLTFRTQIDPAIDYRLRGDSHHLRQVLLNLLSNAIKFTERGGISIEVALVSETDESIRIRFEVRDTGIGMSEGAQHRIFERFVQADESTTRRYGGTGLGTTIAKQLVELMDGVIGVHSTIGRGSAFWFEIPLLKSPLTSLASSQQIISQSPSIAVLVDASKDEEVRRIVERVGGRLDILSSASDVQEYVKALEEQGTCVSAVFVAGAIDYACEIFDAVSDKRANIAAIVYISKTPLDVADRVRLQSYSDVVEVRANASPRVISNAVHAAAARTPTESAEIIDLGQVLRAQRQPQRILVAEDNVTNQTIVRKLLESAGHTVLLASDGEQALDIYQDQSPDLAILDFNMPERNGVEVCTAIRTMEATGTRLPIVILSASVTIEARERARVAGADEFVGKPFEAANLLQVVDRLARRHSRGHQARTRPQNVAPATVALIDHSRIQEVEKITHDATFLTQLVGGFRGDLNNLLNKLDLAVTAQRCTDISEITHAIKGASLGIGAPQLAARCAAIDEAADHRNFPLLATQAREMRNCFTATSDQLTAYSLRKGFAQ